MRKSSLLFMALLCALALLPTRVRDTDGGDQAPVLERYGQVPLRFEAHPGGVDSPAHFLSRGPGYTAFLSGAQAMFRFGRPTAQEVRLKLSNANRDPAHHAEAELAGISNYFIGNDPKLWRTNVPGYGRVRFADVYPGIDLVYHGARGRLEHDFVVAPGADPGRIELALEGVEHLSIDAGGDLVIETGGAEMRMLRPEIYQMVDGQKREIAGAFALRDARAKAVRFEVGDYDRERPLIIDPVLTFATYLGGNSDDQAASVATDSQGNTYVTGYTRSLEFPTQNPFIAGNLAASSAAFVTKMSADGSTLIYSTYLSGVTATEWNSVNTAYDIGVNGAGEAYVVGMTSALDFPVANALRVSSALVCHPSCPNPNIYYEAFITKLNAAGSGLLYSTYLGGDDHDFAKAIAVSRDGTAVVSGYTVSTDFPTVNAFRSNNAGGRDVFVTKLTNDGSVVYSTYLGGSSEDEAFDVALSAGTGRAFVTGTTYSTDFPTALPLATGFSDSADTFISELAVDGSALVFSSFLGFPGFDAGRGVALDAAEAIYVAGYATMSGDAFVTKLSANGAAREWIKYLGGQQADSATGIALDRAGLLYVVGTTDSANLASPDAIQLTNAGSSDAFLAIARTDGSVPFPFYATFLGGSLADFGNAIAVDASANVYLTGHTYSTDFPLARAFQAFARGGTEAFVVKIATGRPDLTITSTALPDGLEGTRYEAALAAAGGQPPYSWSITSGSLPAGLSLDAGGTISGVPVVGGTTRFRVQVEDAAAAASSVELSLTIRPVMVVTTSTLPNATVNVAYSAPLEASGGLRPYHWRLASGALPDGLELGTLVGAIGGVPTTPGTSVFTVEVTDSLLRVATKELSITVLPGGGAPDFTLAADRTSATIAAGDSLSIAVTVTPTNGFAGTVAFDCDTPLPRGVSCSFDPPSLTPSGAPLTTTLQIRTTGPNTPVQAASLVFPWWMGLGAVIGAVVLLRPRRRGRRTRRLAGLLAAAIALAIARCGGGEIEPTPNPNATPKGTTVVQVSASSGALGKALPLTITVE
ncbi:MAG: SBBP repeat-containing protein [Deltaproteobacteria bacterium]|nr:SBBP repeat-containing protein [Deltaproteobacteria bacterium]